MELYLTRQGDGKYMLTKFMPSVCEVVGQNRKDVYVQHGDPVGLRGMCKQFWESFGIKLKRFETIKIKLDINSVL